MGLTGRSDIGLSFPVLSAGGWSRTSHVRWPLWGGRGVISQFFFKEYDLFIVLSSCLLYP